MSHYEGPTWSATPSEGWTLIEIKGGVQLARHALSERPYTLLGRDEDRAHIVLSHESCSRLHARIAFDEATGVPWLRDLQSSHGTKINKRDVPAASRGEMESTSTEPGSRGVVIYPSDIIQFGASTRIYCVEGPESYSRNAQQIGLHKKKTSQAVQSSTSRPVAVAAEEDGREGVPGEDDIVSWGIDMDDHTGEDDEGTLMKLPENLSEKDIPEQLRKDWNAFLAIQYKIEHIHEESERIRRKGELTEGQERQLAINAERMESLRKNKETKEAALYRKLYPEKVNRAKQREEEKSALFHDGEVEDRTKDRKRSVVTTEEAETEEGLLKKRKALVEEMRTINSIIKSQGGKCDELRDRIRMMQVRGDDETFFVQNDLDMAVDALKKSRANLKHIDIELNEVDKLLRIINPKISLEDPLGEKQVRKEEPSFTIPAPISRPPISNGTEDFPIPPPIIPPPSTDSDPTPRRLPAKGAEFPPPPPKRRKVQGATMPPPGFTLPLQGTAAAISAVMQAGTAPSAVREESKGKDEATSANSSSEKHDKWQPPKGQDGSGYTKLNAKFAGRY